MSDIHPGFTSVLGYLTHLKDRASELKAKVVEVRVETLEAAILELMELEELKK